LVFTWLIIFQWNFKHSEIFVEHWHSEPTCPVLLSNRAKTLIRWQTVETCSRLELSGEMCRKDMHSTSGLCKTSIKKRRNEQFPVHWTKVHLIWFVWSAQLARYAWYLQAVKVAKADIRQIRVGMSMGTHDPHTRRLKPNKNIGTRSNITYEFVNGKYLTHRVEWVWVWDHRTHTPSKFNKWVIVIL
jgi:hypothetical protein